MRADDVIAAARTSPRTLGTLFDARRTTPFASHGAACRDGDRGNETDELTVAPVLDLVEDVLDAVLYPLRCLCHHGDGSDGKQCAGDDCGPNRLHGICPLFHCT